MVLLSASARDLTNPAFKKRRKNAKRKRGK